ncbi:CoF synthetase [Formosa sp. PL04]|uniref:CoF synthetase n=1 Tax=Formosa sp. PL04 TaxID=3081755 RepID=UPI002981B223|nr:CoF synthetase [Formosa sp. PL04]MDW5287519.1 CoF synthetase [Formosa sp. PL04]
MIRNKIFWTLDLFKGGKIKNEYNEIKYIQENLEVEESRNLQKRKLKRLLNHAVLTTDFYKNRISGKGSKLSDFPVIDKNIIISHYDGFKSEIFLNKVNFPAYTSGSTGTPFKIYQDAAKKDRNAADVIYFAKLSGFELGDKLYYIRHWDEYNSRSKFETWKRNIHMHPVSKLADSDVVELLDNIKTSSGSRKGIIAYASALNVLRDYIIKHDLKPLKGASVSSIVAMSEALNDRTKEVVGNFFGAKVVSRYSNVENGIIAQQLRGDKNCFHINWASYFVEILDLNSDKPARKGELGRIVITDLFNYCMPMIRYDTGDIGMLNYQENILEEYPILMNIEGRKMDMIYDSEGRFVSSYAVYNILKYPNIRQYQFIQEDDKKYTFKLNVDPEFKYELQIKNEFIKLLGEDVQIDFQYVTEIPLLSSGKRKLVINRKSRDSFSTLS